MRLIRGIVLGALVLLIAYLTIWSALALWYRLPTPELVRAGLAILTILFGLGVILSLFTPKRVYAVTAFTALMAVIGVWWSTIVPTENGNWSPEVARQVTGEINGDILTLTDVREFKWRSKADYTVGWGTRQYDLSTLKSLDMFLSYWAGPEMAHLIFSFGFEDGRYLAWSVEVRRQIGGGFSPLADFFKSNTLSIVASEESDVIGVRTNFRGENVFIYRLNTDSKNIRKLLEEYVVDANELARQPEFFNTLTTNCTTTVYRMMIAVGATTPLNWRLVVNGYLPQYAYQQGVLDKNFTVEELHSLGQIDTRAKAVGLNGRYSAAIRVGVPDPPIQQPQL